MNLRPILEQSYPEGSIGPGVGDLQGQCAVFCEYFMDFGPVGDSLSEKKSYVELNGIIAANIPEIGKGFRIGDVVVTTEADTGHVFIVADMDSQYLYAAESNYNLDGRVHYGRQVDKTDAKIYGIIRAPFKISLGVCDFNVCLFLNNQPKWNLGIFDRLSDAIYQQTGRMLRVNFFPLATQFQNWWYEDFIFNNVDYKVIAKSYLNEKQKQFSFTNLNKPADTAMFIIAPNQWQGSAGNMQEIGWTTPGLPGQIQAACAEFDMSPWYFGMRLIEHLVRHELSHELHWINGLNDLTDTLDTPTVKNLDSIFADLDFNRIKANCG